MADDQREDTGLTPAPWYEESWAVVTAGAAGLLVIGVLIYAVMQTSENSVEPANGPQYYSTYTPSTTTTTTRTTRSTTTRTTTTTSETTSSETTTSETSAEESSTEETSTEDDTSTQATLDEENPFILNPFATTTTTKVDASDQ